MYIYQLGTTYGHFLCPIHDFLPSLFFGASLLLEPEYSQMTMAGFPRGFHGYDVLTQRSAASVTSCTAYKAVQLGMLGLTEEAHSILTFLAEQWDKVSNAFSGPLSESVSDTIQYMYENTTQAPPKGIEKFNEEQLANLEQYTAQVLPYCPDGVNVATGNEKDFEALKAWRERLESSDTNWAKDASTGYQVCTVFFLLTNVNRIDVVKGLC